MRCVNLFQKCTYLPHFPPKGNVVDQPLLLPPIAPCSFLSGTTKSSRDLSNSHQNKDIRFARVCEYSSIPRHIISRSRRVCTTTLGPSIPLRRTPFSFDRACSISVSWTKSYRSMASAAILPPSKAMRPSLEPIIKGGISTHGCNVTFDAEKHLAFTPPSKIYTMKDLHLNDTGVSPIAVSEPFPLFSPAAIHQMRAEVLSDRVWNNCQYSSNLAQCQLRGFAPK